MFGNGRVGSVTSNSPSRAEHRAPFCVPFIQNESIVNASLFFIGLPATRVKSRSK